jgi:hypothetical protein
VFVQSARGYTVVCPFVERLKSLLMITVWSRERVTVAVPGVFGTHFGDFVRVRIRDCNFQFASWRLFSILLDMCSRADN